MTRSGQSMETSIQHMILQQTLLQQESHEALEFEENDSRNPAMVWYSLSILDIASPEV